MDYISTRGDLRNSCNFERVLLDGLAPDGGLYVPLKFPKFSNEEIWSFKHLEYYRLVYEITKDFVLVIKRHFDLHVKIVMELLLVQHT